MLLHYQDRPHKAAAAAPLVPQKDPMRRLQSTQVKCRILMQSYSCSTQLVAEVPIRPGELVMITTTEIERL
jgi:hypothetical protein